MAAAYSPLPTSSSADTVPTITTLPTTPTAARVFFSVANDADRRSCFLLWALRRYQQRPFPKEAMAGARRPQLPGKARIHGRSGHQGPQELDILPRELPPPALWRSRFQPFVQPYLVFPPRCSPRGWIFLYLLRREPLVLLDRTYSDREVLGILTVLTIVIVFMTSVGAVLISALMIGVAMVCTHGAFRVPEDLFLDEEEPIPGFLSFLDGPTPAVANV